MLLTHGRRRDGTAGRHRAAPSTRCARFRAWRRGRPFVGGILVALGGVEMFASSQLDVGNLHIQLGIEGLQATVIPLMLVLLGSPLAQRALSKAPLPRLGKLSFGVFVAHR